VRGGDDEAVAGAAVEPGLHLVGNVGAGPDKAGPLQQGGPVPGQVAQGDRVTADVRRMFCTRPRMPDRLDELVGDGASSDSRKKS